jgi:hypothetical protein
LQWFHITAQTWWHTVLPSAMHAPHAPKHVAQKAALIPQTNSSSWPRLSNTFTTWYCTAPPREPTAAEKILRLARRCCGTGPRASSMSIAQQLQVLIVASADA